MTDPTTLKLVESLTSLTIEMLDQALNRLFEGADDALFEMARRAANNREQTTFLDAMRTVRLGRGKMQHVFLDEVRRQFAADQPRKSGSSETGTEEEVDALTLTDANILEKSIAITNISTKADDLFKQPLFELGRRMSAIINERRAPLSPQAFSPISFCEAFRVAADTQDIEISVTLVLYKLFERLVVSDLTALYNKLLKIFDQYGVRPEKVAMPGGGDGTAGGPGASPGMPPRPGEPAMAAPNPYAQPAPSMAPPQLIVPPGGIPHRLDSQTLSLLQQLAPSMPTQQVPSAAYTDQHLANDLIAAALGRVVPGWEPTHARAYVRRTDAIGQMFNGILADPNLPQELKPQFDRLRFSVIKTALQDVSFFANPNHPVRGLVNELATMAATARATSMDAIKRIEDLVGQIQDQFEVAAEQVRAPKIDPLEHLDIDRFLADQLDKNKTRRNAIIDKVRRVVAEELQLRCTGRNIPEPAWPLLKSGWAPMIAAHLLRHGLDSEPWRNGLDLLNRLVNALDPPAGEEGPNQAELCAEVDGKLDDAGLSSNRRKELLDAFRAALDQAAEQRKRAAERGARELAEQAAQQAAELARHDTVQEGAPAAAASEPAPAPAVASESSVAVEAAGPQPEATDIAARLAAERDAAERAATEQLTAGFEPIPSVSPPATAKTAETAPASTPGSAPEAAVPAATASAPAPASAFEGLKKFAGQKAQPQADDAAAGVNPKFLLDILIAPGSWFRILDTRTSKNRWMKAVSYYPGHDNIAFAEFNGRNSLFIKTQPFLDALVAGNIEPLDLMPMAQSLLDHYISHRRAEEVH